MREIKFKYLLIVLMSLSSYALKEGKSSTMDEADKILVRSITTQYAKKFRANIKAYNSKRSNLAAILTSFDKEDRKAFSKLIKKGNIKIFPKINYKNGVARIKSGRNKISFTASTFFDRYYFLNGRKVPLGKGSVKDQVKKLESIIGTKTTSLFDLIISSAYAVDPFEYSLIATTILLSNNFEQSSWCMFCEDEDIEAGKENFSQIMRDIENRAVYCENGVEDELFSYRLDEIFEYKEATVELQQKLKSFFKEFDASDDPKESLNCQNLVESLYKDELEDKYHPYSFYMNSLSRLEVKRKNQNIHKQFILGKCQPFTQLKNCLIDKSYSAREVYNQTRKEKSKRIRSSKSLPKTYPVKNLER